MDRETKDKWTDNGIHYGDIIFYVILAIVVIAEIYFMGWLFITLLDFSTRP